MISMATIDRTWAAIAPKRGQTVVRRVDPAHPVDFFIGYDETCAMQLLFLADEQPDLPPSSQQVLVRSNLRKDGRYAVCFSLVNQSLKDTFISLCWDIVASTYGAETQKAGIEAASNRFGKWLVLMEKGRNSKLSDAVVRGMVGELAVLRDICIPKYGSSHSITGWIGPLHADRDFEYEDDWLEVKSASLSCETISISSFDQLDIDRPGTLVLARIAKTADSDKEAISLNSLVQDIEKQLGNDQDALSTFKVRLVLNGYDESDTKANESFHLHGYEKYRVYDDFPRIRKSKLASEINNGEYTLSIKMLSPWQI